MSEFPECLMPRHEYEDDSGRMYGLNGQRCHRIQFHDGNCLFDRPAEFEPPIEPTNFGGPKLNSLVIPNPAAEA